MTHTLFQRCAAVLVAGLITATAASAQSWPAKPVRIVVPFPPDEERYGHLEAALAQPFATLAIPAFLTMGRP